MRWPAGRQRWPTACASSSSTTGGGASSRSAIVSPTRRVRDALDASFYDLLASEARLASFVAIAKGDVPQHHWFHLGRLVTNVDGRATLMSWGGTMFEYLMPLLLMRSFPGTLLDQSCRASVRRQIEYGQRARRAVGHLRVGVRVHRSRRQLSVPGVRRARARAEARARRRSRRRAVRDRAGQPRRSGGRGARTSSGSRARASTAGSASTKSIDYSRARAGDAEQPPAPRRPARDRARLLRSPPGHVARRAGQRRLRRRVRARGSTPTRASRRPSCCCRSASRARRSSRSRGRPRARRRRRRFRCSRRDASGRRTRRARTTQFLSNGRYTAARHARRRRLQHVARTWRSRASARTGPPTPARITSTCAIRGRVEVWSPTYQPVCREPDEYEATFELDKATFRRRDGDFETQLQVAVSPEDDVEVRRLSITNRGDRPREIEVTSYAEIVLARPEDDFAHPAFGKLFIETELRSAERRPCSSAGGRAAPDETPSGRSTCSASRAVSAARVEWETDRARFLGRGRSPANPVALDGRALSGTTGAVLDPIAALRERVRLAPGAFVRVTFATGVAPDRAAALALARKYRDASAAARAFSMAFTHVHITLQHLGLTDDQAMLFDRLASRVFGSDASCISPDDLARNTLRAAESLGLRHLRRPADRARARDGDRRAVPLARQLLQAQEYWRVKGLRADVVILNEHPADYLDEMQNLLAGLVQEPRWAGWLDKPGGMFLLRSDGMPEPDRRLLAAVARVVLRGDLGELVARSSIAPRRGCSRTKIVPPTAEIARRRRRPP